MKTKLVKLFQIFFIMIFLLGSARVQVVSAQDENPVVTETPVVETVTLQEGTAEQSSATEVAPTEVETEIPTENPTDAPIENATEVLFDATPTDTIVEETNLTDVVDSIDTEGVQIANSEGEPLSLASQETVEALTAGDPYFTRGGIKYMFLPADGICPPDTITRICVVSLTDTPIQDALTNVHDHGLPTDNTIYVEEDVYHEHITFNTADVILKAVSVDTSLVGASTGAPILDGEDKTGTGVTINEKGVSLIGFIIRNYNVGILVNVSAGNLDTEITNNTITNNNTGIQQTPGTGAPGLNINKNSYTSNTLALVNDTTNNGQFINALSSYWGCPQGPVVYGAETSGPPATRRTGYWQYPTGAYLGTVKPTGCQQISGYSDWWDLQMTTPDWSPFKINLGSFASCPAGEVLEGGVCVVPAPVILVTKSITNPKTFVVDDVIQYKIEVTNTGNITLHNITIADLTAPFGVGTCDPTTSLAPGVAKTCTTSHKVTQADVDSGSFSNTATGDSNETPSQDSTIKVDFIKSPSILVTKSFTNSGPYAVDDVIGYKIEVKNTGNITLNNVSITDLAAPFGVGACDPSATLAPGVTKTCITSHKVTQVDVDSGSFSNTATGDSDETPSQDSKITVEFPYNPDMTFEKTITSEGPYGVGDEITYKIKLQNTGNVTLNNVVIIDPSAPFGVGDCDPVKELAPGAVVTCTTSHTVTEEDIKKRSFTNTATGDSDDTAPMNSMAAFTFGPELTVTKIETSSGPYTLGSTISYDIVAKNTGNVVLSNVSIGDPAGVLGVCPVTTTLAVGASKTCSATHVVTAADVTAGTFTNTGIGESAETGPVSDGVSSSITPPPTVIPPTTTITTITTTTTAGLIIPVTGIGGLIPVTGGTQIVSGLGHSCMTVDDGQVICWGLNASGQLGDGTTVNRQIPVFVNDLSGVMNLTAGSDHTCALTSDGQVWCWGENGSGQLGNGTTVNSTVPVLVEGLPTEVTSITAGEKFTCTNLTNDEVWCWGENGAGQLNDGTTKDQSKPVKSKLAVQLAQISGGQGLLLVNDVLGIVNGWTNVQPSVVDQLTNALAISANRWSTAGCAVIVDGSVKCWSSDLVSALVQSIKNAMDVSSGLAHACVINDDETVSCWGVNAHGELGNGTNEESVSATLVNDLSKAHAVAAGGYHTCVLTGVENTAMCWGANNFGQLGNDSLTDSNQPVYVVMPGR